MYHKSDKATTERNAKILRELVKQPDNKLCADCKRNDPRWASWNLGVYLCIRCSGIHRGMGTHISRVKSIDLDMWTPEQMESIQKWGNRRANLYWESHLKAGHVPPDHKMESFIRSKYESRRWAMDGPPPADPAVLEDPAPTETHGSPVPTHAPTASLSTARPASPALQSPTTFRQNTVHASSQSRQLLSAAVAGRVPVQPVPSQPSLVQDPIQTQPQPTPLQNPTDDLFSLDFHAPAPAPQPQPPAKDVKQDILSLFSTAPLGPSAAAQQPSQSQPQAQAPPPVSMMGNAGTGLWGVSSGWTNPTTAPSTHIWGTPATTTGTNAFGVLNTTDIWGANTPAQPVTAKKEDVFGDLWGDFK